MSSDLKKQRDRYLLAAGLQFARAAAIFGAFVGSTMGPIIVLIAALAVDVVTSDPVLIPIQGVEVPALFLVELLALFEIVRGGVAIHFQEEPEFRKIER